MNAPLGTKDKPWRARLSLLNGESSSSISIGQPVAFKVTDLGQVVLPATAGVAMAHPLFAGIAASAGGPGQPIEIVGGGQFVSAIYRLRTRAATTDAFASLASSLNSYGCLLTIDTVNNCLAYSTIGAASLGAAAAVLCQTFGSLDSVASATNLTATVSTTTVKVFVRALT